MTMDDFPAATTSQKLHALRVQIEDSLAEARLIYNSLKEAPSKDLLRIADAAAEFATGTAIGTTAIVRLLKQTERGELFAFESDVQNGRSPKHPAETVPVPKVKSPASSKKKRKKS